MPAAATKRRPTPAPGWSVRHPLQPSIWGRMACRYAPTFGDLVRLPVRKVTAKTVVAELRAGELVRVCRRTLERNGRAHHRSSRRTFFASELLAAEAVDFPPPTLHPALRVLGLAPGCAVEDAHRRYRELAKGCHPDAPTGSAEEFKSLRAVYERALRVLGGGE